MTRLFFDIETIPCDEAGKAIYLEIQKAKDEKKKKKKSQDSARESTGLSPAGMTEVDLSFEETIKAAKEEITLSEEDEDELIRKTALDGTHGRICCIGVIWEDDLGRSHSEVISGEEKDILERFWKISQTVDVFIGHNVFNFDFPFIYQRSIINGVKPRELSFAKYRNNPIYDTMQEWNKWANGSAQYKSLDTLAKVLGFPTSKDDMDGSMVWDYYQEGKIEEICTYCMKDVELTRKIYYKMTFKELAP